MTILSARETKALEFLRVIAHLNDAGTYPTQGQVIAEATDGAYLTPKVRAEHLTTIDRLVARNSVGDISSTGLSGPYWLRITRQGRDDLRYLAQRSRA